jgi:hypothetical protein
VKSSYVAPAARQYPRQKWRSIDARIRSVDATSDGSSLKHRTSRGRHRGSIIMQHFNASLGDIELSKKTMSKIDANEGMRMRSAEHLI